MMAPWIKGTARLAPLFCLVDVWELRDETGQPLAMVIKRAEDLYEVQTYLPTLHERFGERVILPCTLEHAMDHAMQVLGEKVPLTH